MLRGLSSCYCLCHLSCLEVLLHVFRFTCILSFLSAPIQSFLNNILPLSYHDFSSQVANEDHVLEAIRLFNTSTMDAARSGIHQHINLTPEMANEIKVCLLCNQYSL